MEILAQTFGIIGMIFNLLVFQQKTHRGVTMCQFFAAAAFCANYLMLGAFVGGILNLVGGFRAAVFYFKDKTSLFTNWLNSLLETCHDYLYNQFKLKDYNV